MGFGVGFSIITVWFEVCLRYVVVGLLWLVWLGWYGLG